MVLTFLTAFLAPLPDGLGGAITLGYRLQMK